MRRTVLAVSAAVALLAGACGSSTPHASDPTVATAPLSTTTSSTPPVSTTTVLASTTTLPDTAIVPSRITVAYVDAVLAKLNHIYGDAVRSTVAARRLTPAAIDDIDAIYSGKLATEERGIFRSAVTGGLKDLQRHPGDRRTKVVRVVFRSDTCVFATVKTSYTSVALHQVKAPAVEYLGIGRKTVAQTSTDINPTPWVFFFDLINASDVKVRNQCGVSS
jgi:hypothetical protein